MLRKSTEFWWKRWLSILLSKENSFWCWKNADILTNEMNKPPGSKKIGFGVEKTSAFWRTKWINLQALKKSWLGCWENAGILTTEMNKPPSSKKNWLWCWENAGILTIEMCKAPVFEKGEFWCWANVRQFDDRDEQNRLKRFSACLICAWSLLPSWWVTSWCSEFGRLQSGRTVRTYDWRCKRS